MLVRLLYASRSVVPVTPELTAQIFKQCKHANPPLGVTGVLCYSGELFMQALEGGRDTVNRLFLKIATDPRHKDVELLAFTEIQERRFSGWCMGEVNLAKLNPGLVLKYSETPTINPYRLSASAAQAMFDELAACAAIVGRA